MSKIKRASLLLAAAAAGVVSLSQNAGATNLTWDASGAGSANPTDGSGFWDTANAKWSNGASDVVWDNASVAVFGHANGAAGTVTIDDASGSVTAAGLIFNAPGSGSYTIVSNGTDTLNLTGSNPAITTNAGVSATINVPITGSFGTAPTAAGSGLIINGTGSLTLGGVNTYTGDTTIEYAGANGTGVNVTLASGASIGNSGNNIYVGFITAATSTDISVLTMAAGGTGTLTASNLFIDYIQNHTNISNTVGSTLRINGNDTLNVDNIHIDAGSNNGSTKGGAGALILGPGAVLTLNGSGGAGNNVGTLDVANYSYETGGGASSGIVGTVDFSAGTVNGTINNVNLATGKAGSGTGGTSTAVMTFSSGSLSIGQLNVARRGSSQQGSIGVLTVPTGATGSLFIGGINFAGNGSGNASSIGTINLNGGTMTLTGDMNTSLSTATSVINLAGGTLDMGGHNIGSGGNPIVLNPISGILKNLNNINDGGGITKSAAGTVIFDGNNNYGGNTTIANGAIVVTGVVNGGGNVNVNTNGTLAGAGDGTSTGIVNNVNVNGGTVRPGTTAGDIAKLTVSSFSLHTGTLAIDLGPSHTSDLLNDTGDLNLGDNGSSVLSLSLAGSAGIGSYEIIDYNGSLNKNADFAITGPVGFNYALDYTTNNKVFLDITVSANLLTWNGAADLTSWDTAHANFTNGTSNVVYADGKDVLFSDSAPANATTVSISGTLSPNSVTVSSSSRNYTFQGSGTIAGSTSLTKDGTSTLVITNNNSYTGTTTVTNGTVQVGAGTTSGSIGSGAVSVTGTLAYKRSDSVVLANAVSGDGTLQQMGSGTLILDNTNAYGQTLISAGTLQVGNNDTNGTVGNGTITNNSVLALNRTDNITFSNAIAGTGSLVLNTAGVVTLAGHNTFTGGIILPAGATLKLTDANSAGATTGSVGSVSIAAGATVDVGANNPVSFGTRNVHIAGTGAQSAGGAITNSSTTLQTNAFSLITLDADASITGGRIDLANGTLDLQGHTLTISMTNVGVNHIFEIDNGTVTSGNINVATAALGFDATTIVHADQAGSTIVFQPGTDANFVGTGAGNITRPLIFMNGSIFGNGVVPLATVDSPITLEGTITLEESNNGGPIATSANPLLLTGSIGEANGQGSLVKVGVNPVTFTGNNTYSGGTTINAGSIVVGNGGATGNLGLGSVTNNATLVINHNNAFTFANAISGSGTLIHNGTGTTTLTANNSYSGQTLVNFGKLIVDGTHSGAGQYTVAAGASLGGSGTINGQVNVANGGHLAPGDSSIGTLHIDNLSLDTASLDFRVGAGVADQVVVNNGGGLSLNNVSTFNITSVGATANTYPLIVFNGQTINDLSNFALGTTTLGSFQLSLVNDTANNSIDLSVVGTGPTIAQWAVDADGNWSAGTNWTGGTAPNSVDAVANFGTQVQNAHTVTVDAPQTVGVMNFNSTGTYTIAGTNAITLSVSTGSAGINVIAGSHTISAPVVMSSNTNVDVSTGNTLTIGGNLTGSGSVTLTKTSAGTLALKNLNTGSLNVNAGKVQITQKGSNTAQGGTNVIVQNLSIASSAQLDMTNNSMVIDYTGSVGTLVNDTRLKLQGGLLKSSLADLHHALGYADNAVLNKSSFNGTSVDSTSILVKYTYPGDTNLDGKVDVTDLGALSSHWQQSGVWTGGDFNYDGTVNVTDLGVLASNWQQGVTSPLLGANSFQQALEAVGLGNVAVPEPTMLGLLGMATMGLMSRRRRK